LWVYATPTGVTPGLFLLACIKAKPPKNTSPSNHNETHLECNGVGCLWSWLACWPGSKIFQNVIIHFIHEVWGLSLF